MSRAQTLRRVAIAFWVALSASAPGVAAAQIDISDRWRFTLTDSASGDISERGLTLAQDGTTVIVTGQTSDSSGRYSGGIVDPLTGALHLDGEGVCGRIIVIEVPWSIDGVVAPDGSTISGTFAETTASIFGCGMPAGTAHGTRVPDTCGNGSVDADEVCDAGPGGGACCTEYCAAREPGSICGPSGICGSQRCNAAAACVGMPQPATLQCRPAHCAFDTAEFCDGVSIVCPPPSEPDVDADGVLDPCDNCVGAPLERPQLRIGRFGVGPVRDHVRLRARVRLAAGATLPDPTTTWKRVELIDASGASLLEAWVPNGMWDAQLGLGWRRNGDRWFFRSRNVARLSLAPVTGDAGAWEVRLTMPRATLVDTPPTLPLALTLILDGLGPSTRCGQRLLAAAADSVPQCAGPSVSGVIVCR